MDLGRLELLLARHIHLAQKSGLTLHSASINPFDLPPFYLVQGWTLGRSARSLIRGVVTGYFLDQVGKRGVWEPDPILDLTAFEYPGQPPE